MSFETKPDLLPSCASSHNQPSLLGTSLYVDVHPPHYFGCLRFFKHPHIAITLMFSIMLPPSLRLPVELYRGTMDKLELQERVPLTITCRYVLSTIKEPTHDELLAAKISPWDVTPAKAVPDCDIFGDSPRICETARAFGMVWKPAHDFVSTAELHANHTRPEQKSSLWVKLMFSARAVGLFPALVARRWHQKSVLSRA